MSDEIIARARCVGCVTDCSVMQTRTKGGIIRVQTDTTKGFFVFVPRKQFELVADALRTHRERRLDMPYDSADGKRVMKWLKGKQVRISWSVRKGHLLENYYDGVVTEILSPIEERVY